MLIHQESIIAAAPRAVYEVLTDGQKFAAATGMPAELSDRVGEAFSLFGGRVEGRQIELVPGERVVQAWRFGSAHSDAWEPGVYSIVGFTFSPAGDATRFGTDHEGIPPKCHGHIQSGYPSFYQGPLARYFSG